MPNPKSNPALPPVGSQLVEFKDKFTSENTITRPPEMRVFGLPDCDHSVEPPTCTEATCPNEILASPYWDQRRQDLIKHFGTACGEVRGRL